MLPAVIRVRVGNGSANLVRGRGMRSRRGTKGRVRLCAHRVQRVIGIMEHVCEKGRENAWTWSALQGAKIGVVPMQLLLLIASIDVDLAYDRGLTPGGRVGH